jgi:hypothetical protein
MAVTEEWARRTLETSPDFNEALQVVNLSRPASNDGSLDGLVARLNNRERARFYRGPLSRGQFDALVGAPVGETKAASARRLGTEESAVAFALDFACHRLDASTPREAVRIAWRMGIFTEKDINTAIGRRDA